MKIRPINFNPFFRFFVALVFNSFGQSSAPYTDPDLPDFVPKLFAENKVSTDGIRFWQS